MCLTTSLKFQVRAFTNHYLSLISAYAELYTLLRTAKSSDKNLVFSNVKAQAGRLDCSEVQLGGAFGLDTTKSDKGGRLLQMCPDHQLFLTSTSLRRRG